MLLPVSFLPAITAILGQKGRGGNATVTLAHTRTKNLDELCRRAEILIVAAGVPGLVRLQWIRPGATVIDVGVNRVGTNPETGKAILWGDVEFDAALSVAGRCFVQIYGSLFLKIKR